MAKASFQIEDDVEEWVERRLDYGMSKSEWYRYASHTMRSVELALDDIYDPHQYDERREFVIQVMEEAVEEKKKELNHMD